MCEFLQPSFSMGNKNLIGQFPVYSKTSYEDAPVSMIGEIYVLN